MGNRLGPASPVRGALVRQADRAIGSTMTSPTCRAYCGTPRWRPALAQGAWEQVNRARALDEEAADEATSWGAFQVMGFHWKRLGYPSVSRLRRQHEQQRR